MAGFVMRSLFIEASTVEALYSIVCCRADLYEGRPFVCSPNSSHFLLLLMHPLIPQPLSPIDKPLKMLYISWCSQ